MSDAIALPCKRCGAPLVEVPGRVTDVEVALSCDFCGAKDKLPVDAAARALALRVLSKEREWAAEAATGHAARLLELSEGNYLSGVLRNGGFLLASMVAYTLATSVVRGLDRTSVAPLVHWAGALSGIALAFLWWRARVRSVVGPILAAVPPRSPGTPSRCRSCGGELVHSSSSFVRCGHCSASNLATPAVFEERARALASATLQQRRAATNIQALVGRLPFYLSWALTAGGVLGYALPMLAFKFFEPAASPNTLDVGRTYSLLQYAFCIVPICAYLAYRHLVRPKLEQRAPAAQGNGEPEQVARDLSIVRIEPPSVSWTDTTKQDAGQEPVRQVGEKEP